ncbi:MAG: lamin tail domain-containing protein, partial [Thermoplasmata archaeon]|nr:lamin tail domain-containing protein [Thermoplasmata archaeon]
MISKYDRRIVGLVIAIAIILNFPVLPLNNAYEKPRIVINEIMYDPSGDESQYEWIEIYNGDVKTIDLNGWHLWGSIGSDTILNTTLAPGEYLIIAKDVNAFKQRYSYTDKVIAANWSYLSNAGDWVNLSDSIGNVIDSVFYPSGYTENYTAEWDGCQWHQSLTEGGTPGEKNSVAMTTMSITPSYIEVNQGQSFDVSIVVDPNQSIAGSQTDVMFDPNVIHANSVTAGDMMQGMQGVNYFFSPGTIDNNIGKISSIYAAFITYTVSEKKIFVTINFTAVGSGTTTIGLSNVIIGDVSANPIDVCLQNGTVYVPGAVENGTKEVYVYDSLGNPIDAYVEINGDGYYAYHWTGSSGYCDFTMPPGNYTIMINDVYTDSGYVAYEENFTIAAGETLVNEIYVPIGTKEVYVYDSEGNPIDAYVEINGDGYYAYHWTYSDGHCNFTMPPGDYTILVEKSGFDPYIENFTIEANETLINEIYLGMPPSNNPPDKPTLVSPPDGGTGVDLNPMLKVHVIDVDGDVMTVSFYGREQGGSWSYIGSVNAANDTDASIIWAGLSHGTTYEWYAVANDSQLENTSDIWSFTTVSIPPVADFNWLPSAPTTNDVIQFIDGSYDSDGFITNWTWDFGDGAASYEQNPQHQYASAGTYDVTLTVTDNTGLQDSITKQIKVYVPQTIVSIEPAYQLVNGGDEFTVNITVNPAMPIAGAQFDLSFDPNLLEVVNIQEGNLFNGYTTYFIPGSIDNNAGTITGTGDAIAGAGSVSNYGTVATITFRAKIENGISLLNLSNVIVADSSANPIPATLINGSVEVYIPPTIVAVEPDYQEIKAGDEFTVNITVNPGLPIAGAQFDLTFDPTLLEVVNIQEGNLFNGYTTYFIPGSIDNNAGTITGTSDAIAGAGSVSSYGTLATITFRAKEVEGISPLTFSNVVVGYIDGTPLPTSLINGSVMVYIDNTPPVTTLQFGLPYFYNGNHWVTNLTLLYLNATDDLSGVKSTWYRIWHNGWSSWTEYTVPFNINGNGLHYIEYYSIDNAGNIESVHNTTVYVDNTPPVTTLQHGTPYYNDYITSSTPLYINASDDGAGLKEIHYIIDGVEHIAYGNVVINITGNDGWHNIEYYSIDALGNEEQHHVATYYLDNTPPTTTLLLLLSQPNGENGWYVSNVSINFSSHDNGTGVKVIRYWINSSWKNFSQPFILNEGIYAIKYHAEDFLGNEEVEKEKEIKVDYDAPAILFTPVQSSWTNSNISVNISLQDSFSGLLMYRYAWTQNVSIPSSWNSWHNISGYSYNTIKTQSGEGEWYLHVEACDNAGNIQHCFAGPYKVDKTSPPPPAISSPTHSNESAWYSENDPLFMWYVSDVSGIAGYSYVLDHSPLTSPDMIVDAMNGSKVYNDLGDGEWWFHVRAKDNAGNWGSSSHYRVRIDKTEPSSQVDSITPYERDFLPITIMATASDATSGVSKVELWYRYSNDNVTWSSWTKYGNDSIPPYRWEFDAPYGYGYYEFYSIAYDNAGNHEEKLNAEAICRYVEKYTLSTFVFPDGAGYIELNPSGGTYNAGTVVMARAHANNSYIFDHWSGDVSGNNITIQITMDKNKIIFANFILSNTTVYIKNVSAMPNNEVTTPIIINTNAPLGIGSATLKLHYNPSIAIVTSISNGELNNIIYIINNTNGTATMTASTATYPGPTGMVCFAYVTFKAVGKIGDASPLNIVVDSLYDASSNPQPIYYTIKNGTFRISVNDTSPPMTTIYFSSPYYYDGNHWITSSTPLYLNATDDLSGVNSTWYRIWHNGWSSWTEYTAPFSINGNGLHYIEYYSIDNAGNIENVHNTTVYVDNTPPTTMLQHGMPYYNDYITSSTP